MVKVGTNKPNGISISNYGRFLMLLDNLSNRNTITNKINGKPMKEVKLIKNLEIKNSRSFKNLISILTKEGMLKKYGYGEDKVIYINPLYAKHKNFEWYKEVFDIFEENIKNNLKHLEYIKIKSNWYNISNTILCKDILEIEKYISGIYRLYKNNRIVYIGKSKCIKTRINQHTKEKDIDSIDFTILNNESDKNIYELYYIDKYKPIYNNDCVEESETRIKLEELIFSDRIKL